MTKTLVASEIELFGELMQSNRRQELYHYKIKDYQVFINVISILEWWYYCKLLAYTNRFTCEGVASIYFNP